MSVAVYNHYKRLYHNLPQTPTNSTQTKSSEVSNTLITNLPAQQQRTFVRFLFTEESNLEICVFLCLIRIYS